MARSSPKSAIRRAVIDRIKAMDPETRQAQESALVRQFERLPGFSPAGSVLLYASAFVEEFDTRPMLRVALELGKRLILPRVDRGENRLRLFEVTDLQRHLVPGVRDIPEPRPGLLEIAPEVVDWVLVPGVAFDRRGYRIGRGAGHYDRLLPKLRTEAPRWSLILGPQWSDPLPIETHDEPVDGIADPDSIWVIEPGRLTR
ncbi:5-formyltetrahydrofolate cyclo-ligase [Tundrisphaera lichenicola]|uniref:5-formyltetrahydrofolate cyclo-ligase n=1 Tax=Tundrisphaera lichenicola TaxID=2029860 RepID=UPI003EC0AAE4